MIAPAAEALLVARALHAKDEAGERRRARGHVAGVDLALGPGVHAIVGSPEDGTIALHDAVVGARAPLRGSVRVAGADPARSAAVRRRIGALGEDPWLPSARTVEAAVAMAMAARRADPAAARAEIDALGLGALLARPADGLGWPEARAVELAIALATPDAALVALHEPLCEVATFALAHVRARVAAMADAGACVLVTTSSIADARALGARAIGLARGALRPAPLPADGPVPGELVATVAAESAPSLRALAARLAERAEVRGVAWLDAPVAVDGRAAGPARLAVFGDDLDACAVALAEDAIALDVRVASLRGAPAGRPAS